LSEKTTVLKTAIDKSDAIIIGAGAGLSVADTFNTL
jgi:NAD-dependent SIR2 family protein deacetylase